MESLIRTCRKEQATCFPVTKETSPIREGTGGHSDRYFVSVRREQRSRLLKEETP